MAAKSKHTPQIGKKKRLTELADRNEIKLPDKVRTDKTARTAIERLQKVLHLKMLPERIECFDISHFQGSEIVVCGVFHQRTAGQGALPPIQNQKHNSARRLSVDVRGCFSPSPPRN